MDIISLPNFFANQLLAADDLTAALEYQRGLMRRHCQKLFTPGVADGMDVSIVQSSGDLSVTAGMAIDKGGQEIVLMGPLTLMRQEFSPEVTGRSALLGIRYQEQDDPDTRLEGDSASRRKLAQPGLKLFRDALPDEFVLLAVVDIDTTGKPTRVNTTTRLVARARMQLQKLRESTSAPKIPRGSTGSEQFDSPEMDGSFLLIDVVPTDNGGALSWTVITSFSSSTTSRVSREVIIKNEGDVPTGYRFRVFQLKANP